MQRYNGRFNLHTRDAARAWPYIPMARSLLAQLAGQLQLLSQPVGSMARVLPDGTRIKVSWMYGAARAIIDPAPAPALIAGVPVFLCASFVVSYPDGVADAYTFTIPGHNDRTLIESILTPNEDITALNPGVQQVDDVITGVTNWFPLSTDTSLPSLSWQGAPSRYDDSFPGEIITCQGKQLTGSPNGSGIMSAALHRDAAGSVWILATQRTFDSNNRIPRVFKKPFDFTQATWGTATTGWTELTETGSDPAIVRNGWEVHAAFFNGSGNQAVFPRLANEYYNGETPYQQVILMDINTVADTYTCSLQPLHITPFHDTTTDEAFQHRPRSLITDPCGNTNVPEWTLVSGPVDVGGAYVYTIIDTVFANDGPDYATIFAEVNQAISDYLAGFDPALYDITDTGWVAQSTTYDIMGIYGSSPTPCPYTVNIDHLKRDIEVREKGTGNFVSGGDFNMYRYEEYTWEPVLDAPVSYGSMALQAPRNVGAYGHGAAQETKKQHIGDGLLLAVDYQDDDLVFMYGKKERVQNLRVDVWRPTWLQNIARVPFLPQLPPPPSPSSYAPWIEEQRFSDSDSINWSYWFIDSNGTRYDFLDFSTVRTESQITSWSGLDGAVSWDVSFNLTQNNLIVTFYADLRAEKVVIRRLKRNQNGSNSGSGTQASRIVTGNIPTVMNITGQEDYWEVYDMRGAVGVNIFAGVGINYQKADTAPVQGITVFDVTAFPQFLLTETSHLYEVPWFLAEWENLSQNSQGSIVGNQCGFIAITASNSFVRNYNDNSNAWLDVAIYPDNSIVDLFTLLDPTYTKKDVPSEANLYDLGTVSLPLTPIG